MLRLTLGGDAMLDFPAAQAGGYVKLRLPDEAGKVAVRTYTIRQQRDAEIDIDFALHAETASGTAGPATEWATNAAVGDTIEVGGPGPAKPLPAHASFYLCVGDMTAMPAIAVNLAALPPDARGIAVIEVMSAEDAQDLARPSGMELVWVVTPQPGTGTKCLVEAVQSVPLPADAYVWCACEFGAMRTLRSYFRDELGLGSESLYISSYWKSGLTEEEHKVAKRDDSVNHR